MREDQKFPHRLLLSALQARHLDAFNDFPLQENEDENRGDAAHHGSRYGVHTEIGDNFFGNYNLTVQDDANVTIGDNVNFGPNVTIVMPVHPLIAAERRRMLGLDGIPRHLCYARHVIIGMMFGLGQA